MSYWVQFQHFDPISGSVPAYPFKQLPAIAERARAILKGRPQKQIVHAAEAIDWMVDEYFRQEKDSLIQRILETGSWELGYLEYEARNEQDLSELLDNWPSDADNSAPFYPNKENTHEFEALLDCIDGYIIADDADFPSGKEHDYFAVLALWKVADCLNTLDPEPRFRELDESLDKFLNSTFRYDTIRFRISQSMAVDNLIEAMQAVCWAERAQATNLLTDKVNGLSLELDQLQSKTDERAASIAKERLSLAASKAAIKRHTENRAMKADVFTWCAEHLHTFPSMDKAAEAIAGNGKLVPIAVRTARQWIADWAKQQRSARTL